MLVEVLDVLGEWHAHEGLIRWFASRLLVLLAKVIDDIVNKGRIRLAWLLLGGGDLVQDDRT